MTKKRRRTVDPPAPRWLPCRTIASKGGTVIVKWRTKLLAVASGVALVGMSLPAQAAVAAPFSPIPVPRAGNTAGSIRTGTVTCHTIEGVKVCDGTIYTHGLMNGWATSNRIGNRLNLRWQIRNPDGKIVKTGEAYCETRNTYCEKEGPSYAARWPQSDNPRFCVDTIGYADYLSNTSGATTRVTSSDFDCVNLLPGGGGALAPKR